MARRRFIPSVFFGKFLSRLFIIFMLIVVIVPLIWMFSLSFRSTGGLTQSRFLIFPVEVETGNYAEAIRIAEERQPSIPTMFKNSTIVVVSAVVITLIIATAAGYALAKYRFKGKNIIFYTILLTMMVPVQATLIPIFLFVSRAKMLYTYQSLILAYVAMQLPFAIFVMRQFFMKIPYEIMESGRIDGASEFGIFLRLVLPLAKPAIATVTILIFMFNWNEFILALILMLKKSLYTLPVGLASLIGEWYTPWGVYSAMVFITIGPVIVVFAIFQNWFIKGLTAGSVKG